MKKKKGKAKEEERAARDINPELSYREIEVFEWMARGLSSKKIADIMNIAKDTVETHRKSIFKKMGVKNAPEAIACGFRNKLLE